MPCGAIVAIMRILRLRRRGTNELGPRYERTRAAVQTNSTLVQTNSTLVQTNSRRGTTELGPRYERTRGFYGCVDGKSRENWSQREGFWCDSGGCGQEQDFVHAHRGDIAHQAFKTTRGSNFNRTGSIQSKDSCPIEVGPGAIPARGTLTILKAVFARAPKVDGRPMPRSVSAPPYP